MKRLCSVWIGILGMAFIFPWGCSSENGGGDSGTDNGGGETKLEDLFPASNEVAGWVEDLEAVTFSGDPNTPGPMVTDCIGSQGGGKLCAEDYIDGEIGSFPTGWKAMAQEYYKNGALNLSLSIHQLDQASTADQFYQTYETQSGKTWTDFTMGAGEVKAHILDVGLYWRVNAIKGPYLVEIVTRPKSGEGAETAAKDFTKAVMSKIP